MGLYIDPTDMTKEAWLAKHAAPLTADAAKSFDFNGDSLPVCLVDNRIFTAAGICPDHHEVEAFLYPDGRPRKWFVAKRADLAQFMGLSG